MGRLYLESFLDAKVLHWMGIVSRAVVVPGALRAWRRSLRGGLLGLGRRWVVGAEVMDGWMDGWMDG